MKKHLGLILTLTGILILAGAMVALGEAPQIDAGLIHKPDIAGNPIVRIVANVSQYVLAVIAGIAIFAGIINIGSRLLKHLWGKSEFSQGNSQGVFGTNLFKTNSLMIALSEFVLGIVLMGLVVSGSWLNLVNGLLTFGDNVSRGLGDSVQTQSQVK